MDHDAPGEILEAPGGEEPTAPNTMAYRAVDQQHPECYEEKVGAETHTVHKGTGHEGRGNYGEHSLVGGEQKSGDAGWEGGGEGGEGRKPFLVLV